MKRSGWVRARLAPKSQLTRRASSGSRERESRQLSPAGPAPVFSTPLLFQLVGRLLGRSPSWTSNQTNPLGPAPHASHAHRPSYPRHVFLPACLLRFGAKASWAAWPGGTQPRRPDFGTDHYLRQQGHPKYNTHSTFVQRFLIFFQQ